MKKCYMVSLLILIVLQLLSAERMVLSYNFDKPEIISKNGYDELTYKDCRNLGKEGYPSLPHFAANILLPQNQELLEVKIVSAEYFQDQAELTIKPAGRQFPISSGAHPDYEVIPNEEIYNSKRPYPNNIIDNADTHFLCGHSIAAFTLCPIIFYPADKQVEFLKSITIEIQTSTTREALEAQQFVQTSHKIQKRIRNIVENPEILNRYSYSQTERTDAEDILLITNEDLLPSFETYINFKQGTGFAVSSVTTEEINSGYPGSDLQEKIRNCIIDHYSDYETGYVILGGDDNVIPHRGLYATAHSAIDSDIPADIYYSNLDGNWNTDGDSNWGEAGEDDLFSELSIGRICAENSDEILNHTHKLKMYQDNPVTDDLEKALWLGEDLGWIPWGGDYKDEIIGGSSAHGYTTIGVPEYFDVSYLYHREGGWNKYDVFDQYNDVGMNFRNHLGHSDIDYNMLMYNSDLTTTNFTNDGITKGYVIGYSQGCFNGAFESECFAEKITTMQTADVAEIANSRYGWGDVDGTDGASQYFDRQFFDAVFGEDITIIGDANADSKEDNTAYINSIEGTIRWCYYEINLFGDPSMDIWTENPVELGASYPANIPVGASSIPFSTDTPFSRIGLMQNGILLGRAVTDESGYALLQTFNPITIPETISVSIIGHNKIRHYGEMFVVSDAAYVVFDEMVINDSNENGIPEYGENLSLDVSVKNWGNIEAENVSATISSNDSFITIIDDFQLFGNISGMSVATELDAFEIQVANDVPNQHSVMFEMNATDGNDVWISYFSFIVSAPILEINNVFVDDGENNILDPGETADISVSFINMGGAAAHNVIVEISTIDEFIILNNESFDVGVMDTENIVTATFNITVDDNTEIGHIAEINWALNAELEIEESGYFSLAVSQVPINIEEHFNTFPPTGWYSDGGNGWQQGTNNYAGGSAPEAEFYYSNGVGIQRLITMPINSAGSSSIDLEFKHYISDFAGSGYELRLETTSDGENWNAVTVWQAGNMSATTENIIVATPDVGSETLQLAWTFDGDFWNINWWDIDDVYIHNGVMQSTGNISGIVELIGGAGDVTQCEISVGEHLVYPEDNGSFFLSLYPGTYEVSASLFGYEIVTHSDVEVFSDETTMLDFSLSFMASPINLTAEIIDNNVELNWENPEVISNSLIQLRSKGSSKSKYKDRNTRMQTGYRIYRNDTEIAEIVDIDINTYYDEDLENGDYIYYITSVFEEGESEPSDSIEVNIDFTDVSETLIPVSTLLTGNFPNPFNPSTEINFQLSEQSNIEIIVYNIKGQEVKTLINTTMNAGYHKVEWQGRDKFGNSVSSGIYFYSMKTADYSRIKKMIMLK